MSTLFYTFVEHLELSVQRNTPAYLYPAAIVMLYGYYLYRGLQVGCQQAQTLENAYQTISIHLNKQFYSSNWPITTMPRVFCICNLTTNLQSSVSCLLWLEWPDLWWNPQISLSSSGHLNWSSVYTCNQDHLTMPPSGYLWVDQSQGAGRKSGIAEWRNGQYTNI